jgi:TetR/AcrR family transcriptional regulator
MVVLHRAIQAEDKAARRATILAAAGRLLEREPENFASVAQVAEEAGLAKGTVYLYFKTKEEMLMAIHAEQASRLFDAVEAVIAAKGAAMTAENAADCFCGFVQANPLFLQVAGKCHSSFERNIDPEFMYQFRLGVAHRLSQIGPQLEAIFPALEAGQGVELLNHTYAFGIGTWQLCDPSQDPEGMARPGLEVLRRDPGPVLYRGLMALWRGFVSPQAVSAVVRGGAAADTDGAAPAPVRKSPARSRLN